MRFLLWAALILVSGAMCVEWIEEKDMTYIVLNHGEYAAGIMRTGMKQLTQVSAPPGVVINQVTCKNKGSDGRKRIWKCVPDASMPDNMYLSNYDVSCEKGYMDRVLVGSCVLVYSVSIKTGKVSGPEASAQTTDKPANDGKFLYYVLGLAGIGAVAIFLLDVCNSKAADVIANSPPPSPLAITEGSPAGVRRSERIRKRGNGGAGESTGYDSLPGAKPDGEIKLD